MNSNSEASITVLSQCTIDHRHTYTQTDMHVTTSDNLQANATKKLMNSDSFHMATKSPARLTTFTLT